MLAPASTLNARITAPGVDQARTIAALMSEKAGPYNERVCSHCRDVTAMNGSLGNDARTVT